MKKRVFFLILALVLAVFPTMNVYASLKSDAQKQKQEAQKQLEKVNSNIENLEEDKEAIEEEIVEIDAQLVDLLLTVDLITGDIENKQAEINQAELDYEAAVEREEEQYESMKRRIKFMYEKGDTQYIEMFLQSKSIADIINKSDYVEKLYDYDRQMLINYQQTKEEVGELWNNLEEEKAELVEMQEEYVIQSDELKALVDQKKSTLSNFESQLSAAKAKAGEYQNEIKKQTAVLKQIEAEEAAARKKAAEEAKKKKEEEAKKKKAEEEKKKSEEGNDEDGNSEEKPTELPVENPDENSGGEEEQEPSGGGNSGGSEKGREIANFACQYVGNPYVPGGTSLTNGADCSGFTYAVYKNFGYSIPRSSYSQSTYGTEVSYSNAQPGDIIYYGGHVGIYIGNGKIVHASTQSTGIKISNALYRSIITVRRIV